MSGCSSRRVFGRLLNDIKKQLFKFIPRKFIHIFYDLNSSAPKFKKILNSLKRVDFSGEENNCIPNEILFSFLKHSYFLILIGILSPGNLALKILEN